MYVAEIQHRNMLGRPWDNDRLIPAIQEIVKRSDVMHMVCMIEPTSRLTIYGKSAQTLNKLFSGFGDLFTTSTTSVVYNVRISKLK